jgi:hypothetical protein
MTDTYPHDRAMITFLTARLDDEERIAFAASGAPWSAAVDGMIHVSAQAIREDKIRFGRLGYVATVGREEDRQHIAHHHPAHVLADIAWKRELLALAATVMASADCSDTSESTREIGRAYVATFLHHTVKSMTRAYRDHPDYQPEWHNTRHQTDRNQT